ncbi:MAG: hypothetical protein RR441_05220 [Longicatena sp.]
MNKLKELRLSNNKLDNELTSENSIIMVDIVCYLRSSDIYDEQIEEIRHDLLAMFLDAQNQNVDIHERIGDDFKAFCDEIIASTPKKTKTVKIIELIEIVFYEFVLLSTIMLLFNIDYTHLFENGIFQTYLSVPILSLILFFVLMTIPFAIYEYVTKTALKKERKRSKKLIMIQCVVAGITAGICVTIYAQAIGFSNEIEIPLVTIILIILVAFICKILLTRFVQSLHKKHIQMTKTLS